MNRPGTYPYAWVSGPNSGYGFTSGGSDYQRRSIAEHEASIRNFLVMVDPTTGFIEDES